MKILIVDDEEAIRQLIKFNLERAGFSTVCAATGGEALKKAGVKEEHSLMPNDGISLVILDLMLPDMSGLEVCRSLKCTENTSSIPIIMVTARTEDSDIVKGLEIGADDYITKPFSPRVLVARVKSVLRRHVRESAGKEGIPNPLDVYSSSGDTVQAGSNNNSVSCGALFIDIARHKARIDKMPLDLSATEFAILLFLARHAGQVFSRRQIIDAIKGSDYPVTERSVDVQVLSIRRKIAGAGGEEMIETIRSVGYRMKDDE